MIEGVKIDVTSLELVESFQHRVAHHAERHEFYTAQVAALRAGGVVPQAQTNDPAQSLEQSARVHADRAAFFEFMADHVIPNEIYRLSEADLTRLELLARYLP